MSTRTKSRPTVDPHQPRSTIRIYNTLTRCKEPLVPVVPGKIGIYLCGPTVYKPSHIGHMVGPVIFDAIKRYLVYSGYRVTWVVNITDVDDKLIAESHRRGMSMAEVAQEMTDDYLKNLKDLGVDGVDHFPQATEHISEIIVFIQSLIDAGFAYASAGDVYFDVSSDPNYGKLSGRNVGNMQGEGGEAFQQKRNVADFALWKSATEHEPSWQSPWGPGRPGWHIECSAMSRHLLGESFDIHGGGLDLLFPHHENEISQSESCHGKPMARYWMHNGLMQSSDELGKVGGRNTRSLGETNQENQVASKLSKSTGARPLRKLFQEHAPETIRFLLLRTHYRRPIEFGEQQLVEVRASLDTFYRFFKRCQRLTGEDFYAISATGSRADGDAQLVEHPVLPQVAERRRAFLAAMDDDFNTGGAIAELFELVRVLNKYCDDAQLENTQDDYQTAQRPLKQGVAVLNELAATLGLFAHAPDSNLPGNDMLARKLIDVLISMRNDARKNKDFATADRIRDSLGQLGIQLEDRANKTEWSIASDTQRE